MGYDMNKFPNPKSTSKKMTKATVDIPQPFVGQILEKSSDPQMCEAYLADINEYIHNMEMEAKNRPMPEYIEKVQKKVSVNMRAALVNLLVHIAEEHGLLSETLYLAVSYVDRFLSINILKKHSFSLLGVSSMLIAVKYEEMGAPDFEDFFRKFENIYTKQEIVKMEANVLKALNFEMGYPTINSFLRRFTEVAQEDYAIPNLELKFLICYLAELSLLEYSCLKFLPSMVAASATFLARFTLKPISHPWNRSMGQLSGYKPSDLKECVQILHDLQSSRRLVGDLMTIREKYKKHKFGCVSELSSPSTIPTSFFDDLKQ